MDDAVAVALEWRAGRAFTLVEQSTARARRVGSVGRAWPVAETDIAEPLPALPLVHIFTIVSPGLANLLTWRQELHTYQ